MIERLPDLFGHSVSKHIRPVYQVWLGLAAAILALFLVRQPAQAQSPAASESIRSFESNIDVQENGSLQIEETLRFFTPEPRHGIYRQIPYRYQKDGWRFTTRIDNVQVRADEKRVPVEQSTDGKFLTLKIGDADVTFTGEKKYMLGYRATRAIQAASSDSHSNLPELYWDITGESWQIPIDRTLATITAPSQITQAKCFSGPFGTNDGLCQLEQLDSNTVRVQYQHQIAWGDNLTVRLQFDPGGSLQAPTRWTETKWWLSDHWPLALLFIPPFFMVRAYVRRGRDFWYGGSLHTPNVTGPVHQYWPWALPATPLIYQPPTDFTPGEAAILLTERSSPEHVVAELLELARRGYITIQRRNKRDYWFIQTNPTGKPKPLTSAQSTLLTGLFASGTEVSLTKLKGTFYTTAQTVLKQLEQQLVERQLVSGRPGVVRGTWLALGLMASGITAGLALALLSPFVPWIWFPLEVIALILCFACGWAMPRRTATGSNAAWQIKGLQQTIRRGLWREKIKEKHLFIEEVLPFAVSLGVVKQLTRDLKDLQLKPPEYAQALTQNGFLSASLMSNFHTSAVSSFAPPSNSSSGWSGGGSSGGGGGGGGGGSW